MNRIALLLLLLLKLTNVDAGIGGCGPAIMVKNYTQKKYNFTKLSDTLHLSLNPADSTLEFGLYMNETGCNFSNVNWSKNGTPIANGLVCHTHGSGVYRVSGHFDNYLFNVVISVNSIITDVAESEENPLMQINILPNPSFYGLFMVKRELAYEPFAISLYNVNGELVKQLEMKNKEMVLEISDFEKGAYILEWTSKNGESRRKKFIYN